jgi:ribonuclease Y
MEVAILAEAIASEIGLDSKVCKKAGLLHDIGKALDHQVQGSHTDIGIRILERFNIEKEVISAMKSHHEEYPIEIPEAVVVMVADQISGARPGARRETLESYLQRLEELENIALSFDGVEKAYAISAGREIRVFVDTKKIDDFKLEKLAREIAKRIEEELVYPGEIKVTAIREKKVVEYAK